MRWREHVRACLCLPRVRVRACGHGWSFRKNVGGAEWLHDWMFCMLRYKNKNLNAKIRVDIFAGKKNGLNRCLNGFNRFQPV